MLEEWQRKMDEEANDAERRAEEEKPKFLISNHTLADAMAEMMEMEYWNGFLIGCLFALLFVAISWIGMKEQ